jgi:hypothetical protein
VPKLKFASIVQKKTKVNLCKYDKIDPSVKEKLQSSQSLRCGQHQRVGGWAKELLGIIKMIVYCIYCTHV